MIAYLMKLSADNNNNRYYKMIQNKDIIEIEYGRVGAKPMKMKRPMQLWNETFDKHIKDGYVDRTDLLSIKEIGEYKTIEDPYSRQLIEFLISRTKETINECYSVSYTEVSSKMISAAQEIINNLGLQQSIETVNDSLKKLFVTIPRKMKNVSDYLVADMKQVGDVIEREQELLDIMASQVDDIENSKQTETILEANGLSVRLVESDKEIDQIKSHMGERKHHFVRAYRVKNKKTDENFLKYCKDNNISKNDIHFYYHGSKNENYWGIMKDGQKLNPNASVCGKMFGYGLYYANKAKKSMNYTSISARWRSGVENKGYLAVFKVAYKNPLHVLKYEQWMANIRSSKDIMWHDALFAHGGLDLINDEIIVYNEKQVSLCYMIEIK